MPLRKRGKWWYGDSQSDIRDELTRVGKLNDYVPTQFADAICICGARLFRLRTDEAAGVAIRTCATCGKQHLMGDSAEFFDDAEPVDHECVCRADAFEITVGVSLFDNSDDVHWLYVGCRCPSCGLTGCYADWKNEFIDYRKLLAQV
ncbi:MAG TPA: hypothetical protein VFE47_22310 [Tepidisphaeraceae bacterium]|jgi:hypothetical protein|nr:hypothetical protein [Tepidisphaeraceae bacterium]